MRVKLYLMRHRGRRLSWQDVVNSKPLAGDLGMYSIHHRNYGQVQVLELRDPTNQTDSGRLSTLFEPVLRDLGTNMMVFKGIERLETQDGPVGMVQEWRVVVGGL